MNKYEPILDFIRGLYPGKDSIPLHEPSFIGNEKKYLIDCIDSTYVSSVGRYVDKFEEMVRDFTGAGFAVATVNGTAALHVALKLVGVQQGDLVITQPLTFIATCNAISYTGAEPVFIDIDRSTLGLSPDALETWLSGNVVLAEVEGELKSFYLPQTDTNERSQMPTNTISNNCRVEKKEIQTAEPVVSLDHISPGASVQPSDPSFVPICDLSFVQTRGLKKISACVPMHTFGHPCEIDRIIDICDRYHIAVVEDSAESLGSYYRGQHTGTFGKLGVLSFNGNKTITTGGGGMILTDDERLGKLAKHITTTAKIPHPWKFEHDMLAYNYRLPNINSALGCAQMEVLPELLRSKRDIALRYQKFFLSQPGFEFISEPANSVSNYWLCAVLLPGQEDRDAFLDYTNKQGLITRPAWTLMNKLPMFRNSITGDLAVSQNISDRLVNMPSSPNR